MADPRDFQRPSVEQRLTVDGFTIPSTSKDVADERTWVLSRNIRQPIPFGAPRPSLVIDVLRPEDLVNLSIECYNVRLDLSDPVRPALTRDSTDMSAFLAVQFPTQSVQEEAYYDPPSPPLPTPPFESGLARAHAAGPSRLVFRLPDSGPGSRIPYSTNGLLNWTALIPQLDPRALPPEETPPAIAATPTAPGVLETAIELPYRLLLSPDRNAAWHNAVEPVSHAGRTEVWHTRLTLPDGTELGTNPSKPPAYARALWSLDYGQDYAKDQTKHEPGGFRSSMTPYDRRQVVRLSSDYTLTNTPPAAPAAPVDPYGGYSKAPVVAPLAGSALTESAMTPYVSSPVDATIGMHRAGPDLTPRSPTRPIEVEQLMLSPLGGWLKSRGAWDPQSTFAPKGESLIVSEWRHIASQGRDEYVRLVYEGYLFPFGHRAALIKVTERKFLTNPNGSPDGTPYAYLQQHDYVVVRQPVLTYPSTAFDKSGREMPYGAVEIKTLLTPDILDPATVPLYTPPPEASPMAGLYDAMMGMAGGCQAFWIKTPDGPFPFHIRATDANGATNDFTAALAFVIASGPATPGNAALHIPISPGTLNLMTQGYDNANVTSALHGQRLLYAPPLDGSDTTTLTTDALMFSAKSAPDMPSGFVPWLRSADVRLTSVEHLLGAPATTTISYFSGYLDHGYDTGPGVFAEFKHPVATVFSAEKGGGVSTPNMSLVGLSQKTGPVGGDASDPHGTLVKVTVTNKFEPKEYFEKAAAKFLGKISLADMFEFDLFADRDAPKITTKVVPPGVAVPKAVITSLEWTPKFPHEKTVDKLLHIHKESEFKLIGSVTRQLVDDPAYPAGFAFNGSLTTFELTFFQIIDISFKKFAFSSQSGQKPTIAVDLDDSHPVKFTGPLDFLNQLEDIIAAGGFGGNGPYLHVTTSGVTAGYSLAIPPVSVGVLSLQHGVFDASLTLPFQDGTPLVDFSFASRSHPFLLTVEAFAGGGFLHLQLDTESVRIIEGAFEFGGNFALDLGVASGGVHILAGIYLRITTDKPGGQKKSDLTGFVRMGGELSVLDLISASVEFDLDLTYSSDSTGGKARGQATLTIDVHVAFFSTSVELTVERSYGGSSGDPTLDQVMSPTDWSTYAAAFA